MGEFANTVLLVYAGLFPIVNPFGSMPLFLGLTQTRTDQQRNVLARRVAVNSFLLLLGSVFIGSHVLEFFGISLPVVRIAGGLVVTAFGWKLLNSDEPPERKPTSSDAPSSVPDSFYPLTMPLTVGPGSISVAVTLGSQRPKAAGIEELLLLGGAAVLGILAIAVTVYLCYRFAERIAALLGTSGTNVVVRLSAFILLCIGIQILWSGWSTLDRVTG
jgi:multiple antibiotic resistance protein